MSADSLPMIIEGPDGSGKTQLAHQLCEELNREYRRPPPAALSSTHGPMGESLVAWWDNHLARPSSFLKLGVYDRCFYVSDPIYQMAQIERDLIVAPHVLARGIARLWSIEPIMVFCLPPFDVQLSNVRHDGRPQLEGVSAQALTKVWNAYYACYAIWSQALYDNVLLYDYTEEDAWERLLDKISSI